MSWSQVGTKALASLTALVIHYEYKKWFETKTIKFKLSHNVNLMLKTEALYN